MSQVLYIALAAGFDDIATGAAKVAEAFRDAGQTPPETPVDTGGTVDEPEDEDDDMNGGQLMGDDEPVSTGPLAVRFVDANDSAQLPAFFTGHHSSHSRQPPNDYGIGVEFVVDDLSAVRQLFEGMFDVVLSPLGNVNVDSCSSNSLGTQARLGFGSDTIEQGGRYTMHIRSGGLSVNRRGTQARVADEYRAVIGGSGNSGAATGSLNQPITIGSVGLTILNVYAVKVQPTDTQWDAYDAAATFAEKEAVAKAIDPSAGFWAANGDTDLTTGVANTGSGGDAVCSGMNNTDNLVTV